MSENTRTTVNVSKESHQYASTVKDEFDESWSEVLEFYANHRAELSVGSDGGTVDVEGIHEKLDRIESAQGATVSDALELAETGECGVGGELSDIQTELDSINSKLRRIIE